MTIEDDIAFLEQVPMLRRLGVDALRILAIGAESYSVPSDQVLFAAGDAADCAFIVQQGSFTLKPLRPSEGEVVATPGTLLGETALLADTTRPAGAVALEDSVVLRISRTMFMKMLESYPEAAQRVRDLIASRADQWARELENIRATLARGTGPR
ncbi:MAG: cyclic nucleotide-binding domain-containing protein [Xanthobacteraceae bacterium]